AAHLGIRQARGAGRRPAVDRVPLELFRRCAGAQFPRTRRAGGGALRRGCARSRCMIADQQSRARAWFEQLRDDICTVFEALEDALPAGAPLADRAAGRFVRTPWQRTGASGGEPISSLPETGTPSAGPAIAGTDDGGGVMAMMHGRV